MVFLKKKATDLSFLRNQSFKIVMEEAFHDKALMQKRS